MKSGPRVWKIVIEEEEGSLLFGEVVVVVV